jgi:hypothetical protein
MLYGWTQQNPFNSNDWNYTATGYQSITVPPGSFWIGYQIYYSSNGSTHGEWMVSSAVTC